MKQSNHPPHPVIIFPIDPAVGKNKTCDIPELACALSGGTLDLELSHTIQASEILTHRESENLSESYSNISNQVKTSTMKAAWDLSYSPVKSIGMNLVMLYFNGSSPNIFTILIIVYTLCSAFTQLTSVEEVFSSLNKTLDNIGASRTLLLAPKIVYLTLCIVLIMYLGQRGIKLGVLPFKSGDYLFLIPPQRISHEAIFSI